jgi:hypothetical protein
MESPDCPMDYFVQFLKKSLRHFNILKENYEEFQVEFEKIKEFVNNCDSQILRSKFQFLLSPTKVRPELTEECPSKTRALDYSQMKTQLRSIKYLTLIVMYLSKDDQTSNCSMSSSTKWFPRTPLSLRPSFRITWKQNSKDFH